MDNEKLGQILAAFDLLAERKGGALSDKPNVAELKEAGVDEVSADERDAAWKVYSEAQAAAEELAEENDDVELAAGDGPPVTNKSRSPLSVFGVLIEPGQTRRVPGYDADHFVMKGWVAKGVIQVG